MATAKAPGDDAAAAGLPIVPGSTLASDIDAEINNTRDMLALIPIARGGTAATTVPAALTNLGLAAMDPNITANTLVQRDNNKAIAADFAYIARPPALPEHATNKAYVDASLREAQLDVINELLEVIDALTLRVQALEKNKPPK
jgi:hypothetical protein